MPASYHVQQSIDFRVALSWERCGFEAYESVNKNSCAIANDSQSRKRRCI